MSPRLLDLITRFAAEVSLDVVTEVINHLRLADKAGSSEAELLALLRRLQPSARQALQELLDTWRNAGVHEPLEEVAATLTGALYQAKRLRAETRTELVWTGPSIVSAGLRNTEQVILDLIRSAQQSIFVVTFAAYKVDSLVAALCDAMARGARVTFILEDKDESGGKVTLSALPALSKSGLSAAKVYVWPLDQRQRNERGQHGSLHAKCVLVDSRRLFVSSANMTEFALTLNIELGVLLTGGDAPGQVERNLTELIRTRVLRELQIETR